GGIAIVIASVEAVGKASLCQQFLGERGIVLWWRRRPVEIKILWEYAAGQMGMPERECLIHRLAVDGQGHGLTHALIVPWRIRMPLFWKIEPVGSRADRCLDAETRRALQLLGEFASDGIGDIDLATLQGRQPRGFIWDHFEHQVLDGGDLAPITLECLAHQLEARGKGDKLVGTRPDRRLLEANLADLLDILLGHDPASA